MHIQKKRGGTRAKSNDTMASLTPGDPKNPGSWLRIEIKEQKLAAYLEFDDTSNLRMLAISWPVLAAHILFAELRPNINPKPAFILLADSHSCRAQAAEAEVRSPSDRRRSCGAQGEYCETFGPHIDGYA